MPSPSRATGRRGALTALFAALVLLLAACGSDPIPISAPVDGESAAPSGAASAVPVGAGSSDLGDILIDDAGFSLYGFTEDADGVPTCDGGCAGAWPPVIVDGAGLPAGLDASVFSIVPRSDGTHQLKAGKWPLYRFAGDTAPGQTTGHLSGDVWFLAAPDGSLIGVEGEAADTVDTAAAAAAAPAETDAVAIVSPASSSLGDVLVSGAGLTLYGFTNDVDGLPTCAGGCAEAWPPILVDSTDLPADLDPTVFSVVPRADGSSQLKAGKWPLYLFAGDTAPGQTTGHLSGEVWFAVSPDGSLIDGPTAETAQAPESTDAESQPVGVEVAETGFGPILIDEFGHSLYGFGNDFKLPTSACVDGCAEAWPPVLVDSTDLPAGLDAEQFSVITRPDGTYQLKSGIWPLYRFAGDTAPGQTTGHLSGGVWFLASADGKLVDFVPPAPAAPAQPAPTAAPAQQPPAPTAPAPAATPVPPTPTAPSYGSGYGSSDGY